MSTKLETVDELWELFNDKERLRNYAYNQPIVSKKGINNEEFHLDLPYEEIKAVVEQERDRFMSSLQEPDHSQVKWEHVGSTSIKGMPGTKFPDALLLIPAFPPSKNVIKAFLDSGYYFSSASRLDLEDLWFFYPFTEGVCEDHKLTVHVVTQDNRAGKILRETRDMCRNEDWAFQDYKAAKIQAAKGETFKDYKRGKGSNSKLLQMLREKYPEDKPQ